MRYTEPLRISKEFHDRIREITRARVDKKLADPLRRNEISLPEITGLLLKSRWWPNLELDMKTLPKRKDK